MMMVLFLVVLLLAAVSPVSAQPTEGIINLDTSAGEQIEYLETILSQQGDMPAKHQVVMLRWLADLYEFIGEYRNVENSYRRILAFFPHDVGVMNDYALFLFETLNAGERAESLLVAASRWGRFTDARSLDRGRTMELLARVELENGDPSQAAHHAGIAIELVDDNASAGARRVLADALRRSGQYDAAAREYIDLIALEQGVNREDINALELFVEKTSSYRADNIGRVLEEAIRDRKDRDRQHAEAEGAELVSIPSTGGVVLEGTLRQRYGRGAVLFIPRTDGVRTAFKPYAQLLGIDSLSSLSLDLRGQGGSRADSLVSQKDLGGQHVGRLVDDVVAGFRFLQNASGIPADNIVIVSESSACALVEKALRLAHPGAPVVYLSPVFDPADRDLSNAISFHQDRPILVVFSNEDLRARQSHSYYIAIKDVPSLETLVLDDAGHGIDVLRRDPAALEFFQDWVRRTTDTPWPRSP